MKTKIICRLFAFAVCIFTSALCPLTSYIASAQSPNKINYQAVARDGVGNPMATQTVTVIFRIHESTVSGAVRYRGTQNYTTNQFGLFSATIGQTASDSGSFATLAWGSNNYFLQVFVNSFDMGTTQFLSVPYSMHSNTAGGAPPTGTAGGKLTGTYPNPTIGTNKVSLGQIQTITASRLLGRDNSGAGTVQELTLGTGLTISSGQLNFSGGGWGTGGNALTGTLPATPNEWLGSSNGADLIFKTNGTEKVRIQSGGNVGIGTSAPLAGYKLHVNGATYMSDYIDIKHNWLSTDWPITVYDNSNGVLFAFYSANGNGPDELIIQGQANNAYISTGTNANLIFKPNGTERVRFTPAGRVGIGTSSPNASSLLDVSSTSAGILIPRMTAGQRTAIGTPAQGLMVYETTTNSFWFYSGSVWTQIQNVGSGGAWSLSGNSLSGAEFIGSTNAQNIIFKTNNTTALVIADSPPQLLSGAFGTATSPYYSFNGDVNTGIFNTGTNVFAISTDGSERMRVDATGNVGIGTPAPSRPLHVTTAGATDAMLVEHTGTTSRAATFQITNASNGSAAVYGTTSGSGAAGYFNVTGTAANAVVGYTTGSRRAGDFTIANAGNNYPALDATTNGTGVAVNGTNSGTGKAASFQKTNAASSTDALYAATNGSGTSVFGFNNGTGSAGIFQVSNAANPSNALVAVTNGTAKAGYFEITNAGNNTEAVYAASNGGGTAVTGYMTGSGNAGVFQITNAGNANSALYGNTNGTGHAVYGVNTGTLGSGGFFHTTNGANASPALYATSGGTGLAAEIAGKTKTTNFQMTSGASTTGYVLSDMDGTGNAQWTNPASLFAAGPWTDGGTVIYPTNSGDFVGIGVVPTVPFEVLGTTKITGTSGEPLILQAPSNGLPVRILECISGGSGNDAMRLFGYSNRGRISLLSGGTVTVDIDANNPSYFNGGNVGIGTPSPGEKLTVKGSVAGTIIGVRNSSDLLRHDFKINGSDHAVYQMTNAGGTMSVQLHSGGDSYLTGGNVGIGTPGPTNKLHVLENAAIAAMQIEQSGTGNGLTVNQYNASSGVAGLFSIANSGNTSSAVYASTAGTGNAVYGNHSGTTGSAGYFYIGTAGNGSSAVYASTVGSGAAVNGNNSSNGVAVAGTNTGSGRAGYFEISNGSNNNNALEGTTNGSGSAVIGQNSGTGRAGFFEINTNNTNSSDALYGATFGTGKAAYFEINNTGNTNTAVYSKTNGTGYAGFFQINNSNNNLNAIFATTNGAGAAINGSNTYSGGNALRDGLRVTVTGTGGTTNTAGYFSAKNSTNNYSIHVDDGHIRSTQPAGSTTASFVSVFTPSLAGGSTDIKGTVNTTGSLGFGNSAIIRVNFFSNYQSAPVVVVSSIGSGANNRLICSVANVGPGSFEIHIYNSAAAGSISNPSFNYIVIE